MFKWSLIRKIEKYLGKEYLEEVKESRRSSFFNGMKLYDEDDMFHDRDDMPRANDEMFDEEDSLEDGENTDVPRHQAEPPALLICPQRLASTGHNVVEKQVSIPEFLKSKGDVEKYIDDSLEETTFAKKLNQYMFEKNLTTAVIYQRCLVDRKLISKITAQREYHPSKSTVLALCIGLQLSLPEGEEFLSLAGYSFNRSSKYDLILKFMLENKIYDLDTINEMLIFFKQPCFE